MMDYSKKHDISVYLTEEQLNERIAQMGAEITKKFAGESVYLVCILKGTIFFTCQENRASDDDRFYVGIKLRGRNTLIRSGQYQEGSGAFH